MLLHLTGIDLDRCPACTTGRMTPEMYVWDVDAGAVIFAERAHSPMAVSPDGRFAAANTTDIITPKYSVGVWNLESGQRLHHFEGLKGDVARLAFSPDGEQLLCAGEDGTLRLWRISDGALIAAYDGERAFVDGAIGPGGVNIAAANALGIHLLRLEL